MTFEKSRTFNRIVNACHKRPFAAVTLQNQMVFFFFLFFIFQNFELNLRYLSEFLYGREIFESLNFWAQHKSYDKLNLSGSYSPKSTL